MQPGSVPLRGPAQCPVHDGINTQVARAEYVKEAVQEDNAGNYQKAFDLYKIALEYFSTHLKYEKNPRAKEAITAKVCCMYLCRFISTACRIACLAV